MCTSSAIAVFKSCSFFMCLGVMLLLLLKAWIFRSWNKQKFWNLGSEIQAHHIVVFAIRICDGQQNENKEQQYQCSHNGWKTAAVFQWILLDSFWRSSQVGDFWQWRKIKLMGVQKTRRFRRKRDAQMFPDHNRASPYYSSCPARSENGLLVFPRYFYAERDRNRCLHMCRKWSALT